MVQFDNQYRQIKIKIVYYGPALGGKTTCLQYIHRVTDPQRRTRLFSLNTASDRTLFFDLLSLNLGRIRGYRLAMQLYTVPGQVQYNATRRAVLSGADGVVFVADSQVDQREANVASLSNLWDNLMANGLDARSIPLVLLYNKRDLQPLLDVDAMEAALNSRNSPAFPAVAITGKGVLDGFAAISEITLTAVADKLGVGGNPQAIERLQAQVRAALEPFLAAEEQAPSEPAADVEVFRPRQEAPPDKPLSKEVLVGEAVRANVAMTDLSARLDTVHRQLERKVRVLEGISEFSRSMAEEHDPASVLRLLVNTLVRLLQVQGAAALVIPGSGGMREAVLHRLKRDPLLAIPDEVGEPLALGIVTRRETTLLAPSLETETESYALSALQRAGYTSALAVPMIAQHHSIGLLTAYGDRERAPLDEDDLQLAGVLAAAAAMGYANAKAWRRLEELNRELEGQVAERTQRLSASLEQTSQLAQQLEEKNLLLEKAYLDLSELDEVKTELITRISHELKTPVTSLLTAARLLHGEWSTNPAKASRFVGVIRSEAEKLTELIDSVVQASVLTATPRAPQDKLVPVADLLKRAIAPLRDLARDREVKLHVLIPNGLEGFSCEPETMETALRAVIKNAVEFNRRGGEVKVEVRRLARNNEPWLALKISDTGVGIAAQEQTRVFDTFWQGGNVISGKPRGVGLGLAIAKRVVESHGGTISLSSVIGEGTQVTVVVPQQRFA